MYGSAIINKYIKTSKQFSIFVTCNILIISYCTAVAGPLSLEASVHHVLLHGGRVHLFPIDRLAIFIDRRVEVVAEHEARLVGRII